MMPANLFAICRTGDLSTIKRVSLAQGVQDKVEGMFVAQASFFFEGIAEEVPFSGGWKPDDDELLTMAAPDEAEAMLAAVQSPLGLPAINASHFEAEGIKGLFMALKRGSNTTMLIQPFSAQQILARRFSLLLDGNTFKELTEPAFTLENNLCAVIENDLIKFKSFFHVKRIFKMELMYREASNPQLETFCGHANLFVEDVDSFKSMADQNIRKLVHAISEVGVLDNCTVADLVSKAQSLGLALEEHDGRLRMPANRKDIKVLLRFLDDGIYEAPLSSKRYVTNSKRQLS